MRSHPPHSLRVLGSVTRRGSRTELNRRLQWSEDFDEEGGDLETGTPGNVSVGDLPEGS